MDADTNGPSGSLALVNTAAGTKPTLHRTQPNVRYTPHIGHGSGAWSGAGDTKGKHQHALPDRRRLGPQNPSPPSLPCLKRHAGAKTWVAEAAVDTGPVEFGIQPRLPWSNGS